MKKLRSNHGYIVFFSLLLLLSTPKLFSVVRDEIYILKSELHEILENIDVKYMYLGKGESGLYDVISQVNELDDNKDSILNDLQQHIDDGYSIGLQNAVVQALEYAEKV